MIRKEKDNRVVRKSIGFKFIENASDPDIHATDVVEHLRVVLANDGSVREIGREFDFRGIYDGLPVFVQSRFMRQIRVEHREEWLVCTLAVTPMCLVVGFIPSRPGSSKIVIGLPVV